MSTPMRHGPSQQGRTPQQPPAAPTPQASTPFSSSQAAAAFSPHGPRTSPQQLKKSPANNMTGNMGQPGAAPLNFDSPSAAAALGGLGLNDLNLDNISMGGLLAGTGRSDEDERKKRLDNVIAALWAFDTGRVSNDGLQRLVEHLGLECIWETNAENDKTLIIGGRTMAIEVGIKNHAVYHVSFAFNEPSHNLDKHVEKASDILLKDLALGPTESILTKKLSNFRVNLERLANLDRLSTPPALNCHEAIAGVWESLDRVYKWDIEQLRKASAPSANAEVNEDALRFSALCQGYGVPIMHARGRIGLSLDYWKPGRRFPKLSSDSDKTPTWSILIECAAMSHMDYRPLRVSDKWIGPDVRNSSAIGLDWIEPADTLIPASDDHKNAPALDPASAALSGPTAPDVAFMATFDPPIVVPHGVAMEIYKLAATSAPQSSSTFDALLFPINDSVPYDPSEPREMTFTQPFPIFKKNSGGIPQDFTKHNNTLFIDKPVYGQVMTHLPFSHPRDLISMLPLLRQYAFLYHLLALMFKPHKNMSDETRKDLDARVASKGIEGLKVDVVLSVHPLPRLQLLFPFKHDIARINIEIQLNGKVVIISDNVFKPLSKDDPDSAGQAKEKFYDAKQWADKLKDCENINNWVEFIKMTLE
ncbi:mediator of RNA polymerase II transcription subunit 1-domain-containing protein [Xylariaceae sp. FL1272]|nr:mediator of RNA polymerase II transcription subunit 1-domain-containing protein [Xylariaceae sp. FL1272]